ncbi:11217_t:CDS:2 [Paraglomus brasilianum]|uniref:11217_t:CDS:1 n=1 Tax=Paraglomus brasilianum TaxID=144538 RepID=A0A9N9AZF0_9GLOM|nr:11217_t:CDS:2 [Paraglomus brasilianum]
MNLVAAIVVPRVVIDYIAVALETTIDIDIVDDVVGVQIDFMTKGREGGVVTIVMGMGGLGSIRTVRGRREVIRSESDSRDRNGGHETERERDESRYGRGLDGRYDPYVAASQYIDTEFCTRKIYVGDLRQVSHSTLHNAFSQFGEITSLTLFEDKGYAFIDYATAEQAAEARRKMNGAHLGGGSILVNRAKRPERNITGFGNVPWSDADGNAAKQNDITSPRNIEAKTAPTDPSLQLPKRRIIAYDDL